jgi:deoxyribonuclease V
MLGPRSVRRLSAFFGREGEEMRVSQLHPWDVSYHEAIEIQKRLQPLLVSKRLPGEIKTIAGVDVSASTRSDISWAGIVVLSYPRLIIVEQKWVKGKRGFPYIPGLLSFRELPLVVRAMEKLRVDPDLILCDGQGMAHPRGIGLASHLGLLLGRPTIGCAKKRLLGESSEVGEEKGSYSPLRHNGRPVGAVVRTRKGVKPVFVSPGHYITLDESIKWVLRCSTRYRIPEPTRKAHLLVNGLRRREGVL